MRVGELSRRSGVSVPSIKYYLREGLLAPGERTGPNQAAYDESHVRRLRLIRALIDVGHLTVAGTRDVLAAVDDDGVELLDALGAAQIAVVGLPAPVDDEAHARAEKLVDDLVVRRGWQVAKKNPGWRAAVDIVASWDGFGGMDLEALLDGYAEVLEILAEREVDGALASGEREPSVESAVLGIVLGGSLLAALRGMAQENAATRRLR